MEINKALDVRRGTIRLSIKASFDYEEMKILKQFHLMNCRIKTKDGSFIGKDPISINIQSAYRNQISKIKNRWSATLVRTSGFIVLDILILAIKIIGITIRAIFRLVFGRRKRLSTIIRGITIKSRRIEKIREAEFFIFVSLASVAKAIDYGREVGSETLYDRDSLNLALEGLDFAGAGSEVESQFEALNTVVDGLVKANG